MHLIVKKAENTFILFNLLIFYLRCPCPIPIPNKTTINFFCSNALKIQAQGLLA